MSFCSPYKVRATVVGEGEVFGRLLRHVGLSDLPAVADIVGSKQCVHPSSLEWHPCTHCLYIPSPSLFHFPLRLASLYTEVDA